MLRITNYKITRITEGRYLVSKHYESVAEFKTFVEAQNFVFNRQSKELVQSKESLVA